MRYLPLLSLLLLTASCDSAEPADERPVLLYYLLSTAQSGRATYVVPGGLRTVDLQDPRYFDLATVTFELRDSARVAPGFQAEATLRGTLLTSRSCSAVVVAVRYASGAARTLGEETACTPGATHDLRVSAAVPEE